MFNITIAYNNDDSFKWVGMEVTYLCMLGKLDWKYLRHFAGRWRGQRSDDSKRIAIKIDHLDARKRNCLFGESVGQRKRELAIRIKKQNWIQIVRA